MVATASLKISPFPIGKTDTSDPFVVAIENRLADLLSLSIQKSILRGEGEDLFDALPLFHFTPIEETFWVTFLCTGENTSGVGRFVDDMLCRWLVPGKNLTILGSAKLLFSFTTLPRQRLFFASTRLEIDSERDIEIAGRNIHALIEEIRLNITAVYKARQIATLKSITVDQKNFMVQENLNRILNISSNESENTLFDQLQEFMMKLNREEKMGQIQKTILQLAGKKPRAFDRGMFSEMTYFTVLFKDQFASKRKSWHISRVIALHYLFKKLLLEEINKSPTERHIRLKIYQTKLNEKWPVLGILLGMNIIRESEGQDGRFLLEAIRGCIPDAEPVKDSYLFDRRDRKVYLFYLEVHKAGFSPFSSREIITLRDRLTSEVKKEIESDVHLLFMPRNEEEIARNLIVLSQQLKYSRDLPQANIQYERQSETELFFAIAIARLIHPRTKSLREQLLSAQSDTKFSIDEIREIGKLRRKIPKETAVLRVSLDKAPFFRPDYSVDLLRARGKVAYELGRVIGEFRDFNGGMILKQEESLDALRKKIGTVPQEVELLLENYFFSIRPGHMQTVLPTEVLKAHFDLLLQFREQLLPFAECQAGRFFLFFVRLSDIASKNRVEINVERLKIPSYDLTNCFLEMSQSTSYLGYLLRSDDPLVSERFKQAII